MKILDCTLRDGGYYTNWDFDSDIVNSYIHSLNVLPIDYIELGYRNKTQVDYVGEYGYCPLSTLNHIRSISSKRIAIMINEKDTSSADLDYLLQPIVGIVDMVRIAVDPKNFERAIGLAKSIKNMGFEVAFNMMYMSTWDTIENFYPKLYKLNNVVDLFCMVDSYGSVTPNNAKAIIQTVKQYTNCKLGFHGHDNLSLALANTVVAIENSVEFVDGTILGMGRGAGNLKIELLLTYLNKYYNLCVDFNVLSNITTIFDSLLKRYNWGTNLPYMLSGANSIPQKEVMSLVQNRKYSLNNIVRVIEFNRGNVGDQTQYPQFKPINRVNNVLLIGGGTSSIQHINAIKSFIVQNPSTAIVFATARYAKEFAKISCSKYYILVGNEAQRMRQNVNADEFQDTCIIPPYPNKLGIDVPDFCKATTFEIPSISFEYLYLDSCTTLALETAQLLSDNVFICGYDGYSGHLLSEKEIVLTNENKYIFETYKRVYNKSLISLFPTMYDNLIVRSIYQMI